MRERRERRKATPARVRVREKKREQERRGDGVIEEERCEGVRHEGERREREKLRQRGARNLHRGKRVDRVRVQTFSACVFFACA